MTRLDRRTRPRRAGVLARLETLESRQLLATFSVTSAADSGAGTLRQAILDDNLATGSNAITFDIPGSGVHSIALASPLPSVINPTSIDATTQPGYAGTPVVELSGANILDTSVTPAVPLTNVTGLTLLGGSSAVKGLTIDRFTGSGIVATRDGNVIAADFIGTDPTGTQSLGNGGAGVALASRNNVIGGLDPSQRNVISGNSGSGVYLSFPSGLPTGNLVQGNFIGTDVTGTLDLGNTQAGVDVESSNNTVGGVNPAAANVIAFNGGAGVEVGSYQFISNVIQNRITGNSIFGNVGLGIDLGNNGVTLSASVTGRFGPNELQDFPSLTSAYPTGDASGITVEGTLNDLPSAAYTVDFYSNTQPDRTGYGQGRIFLGSQVFLTDASGAADITSTLPVSVLPGQYISATATDSNGNTSEFSKSLVVAQTPQADLSVTGGSNFFSVQAGVPNSYYFTISNSGPSKANGVNFTDVLPAGATFVSGFSSLGTVTFANGVASVALGTLTSDASIAIQLTYTIPKSGSATSTASVTATSPVDPDPTNNTITQNTQVSPASPVDLSLFGVANPYPVQVGQPLTYTFVVSNTSSNPATGVMFTDPLPSGLAFRSVRSSQGMATQLDGTVIVDLGDLAGGANATVTLVVVPTTSGSISNFAMLSSNEPDFNAINNSTTVYTYVTPSPAADVAVAITAAPYPSAVGQPYTYTVIAGNPGTAPAPNTVLTDVLPLGAIVTSVKPSSGTYTLAGNVLTVNFGTLVVGGLEEVTVTVVPTASGLAVNRASITSDAVDFNVYNNFSESETYVLSPAVDIGVAITAAPQPAAVNQQFTYTVLVGNAGVASASNVILGDDLGDGASVLSIRPSQGTYTLVGNTLTVNFGTLAPGALAEVTINLIPGAPGFLTNRASVASDQVDNNVANNYDSKATAVVAQAFPPAIIAQKLNLSGNTISNVVLTFNEGLDPASASNLANYQVQDLGSNGSLSASGKTVPIASAVYDAATRSVTLTFRKGLSIGRFYKVIVNGPGAPGLVDPYGNVLDGEANGLQNGIYASLIGRGTKTRPNALQVGVPKPKPPAHATTKVVTHTTTKVTTTHVATQAVKAAASKAHK